LILKLDEDSPPVHMTDQQSLDDIAMLLMKVGRRVGIPYIDVDSQQIRRDGQRATIASSNQTEHLPRPSSMGLGWVWDGFGVRTVYTQT